MQQWGLCLYVLQIKQCCGIHRVKLACISILSLLYNIFNSLITRLVRKILFVCLFLMTNRSALKKISFQEAAVRDPKDPGNTGTSENSKCEAVKSSYAKNRSFNT